MKTIVVLCDPNRIDPEMILSLQRLFPECDIKTVFVGKNDWDVYRAANRPSAAADSLRFGTD
jgi:hypothetical protein